MRIQHLLWFAVGLGTGAVVGVLMAPRAGADTRHLLAEGSRGYYEKGREMYELGRSIADEAADLFDEGRRLIENEAAMAAEA